MVGTCRGFGPSPLCHARHTDEPYKGERGLVMVTWEECPQPNRNEKEAIKQRVLEELLSGRWPVLTVQDCTAEETTRA